MSLHLRLNKNKVRRLSYTLFFIVLLFSCKKDLSVIEGCTNQNALNYNSSATYDDGNCIYDTLTSYQTTPYNIVIPVGPNDKEVNPNGFDLVLFPSSLFHETIPFTIDDERHCIAFDLVPKQEIIV